MQEVNFQSAGEDLVLGVLLRPVVGLHQVVNNIVNDLVLIPGIDGAGGLGGVAALAVLVEVELFCHCLVILLLGDIALLQHGEEDGLLTFFVEVLGRLDLAGLRVGDLQGAQGVVLGGVVGDADEAGTFGQRKLRNVLAEVGIGGGVDAVASLAQVNIVEVGLQDVFLGIVLLKLQGAENLHDLSLDGDLIVVGHVLDQLLGQGGTALNVLAGEHEADGLGRAHPVHTIVLVEALVLDGHSRVLEIFGDLIQLHPDPVFAAVQALGHFIVPRIRVFGQDGTGQIGVIFGHFQAGVGDDYIFDIHRRHAQQHGPGDENDEHDGHDNFKGLAMLFPLALGCSAPGVLGISAVSGGSRLPRIPGVPGGTCVSIVIQIDTSVYHCPMGEETIRAQNRGRPGLHVNGHTRAYSMYYTTGFQFVYPWGERFFGESSPKLFSPLLLLFSFSQGTMCTHRQRRSTHERRIRR